MHADLTAIAGDPYSSTVTAVPWTRPSGASMPGPSGRSAPNPPSSSGITTFQPSTGSRRRHSGPSGSWKASCGPTLARPETLPSLPLALHPSLATLCSPYAVVSLWAAHQEDGTALAVDPFAPESAWVLRCGRSLRVLPMSAGDCRFVGAQQDGATLGDAAETAACPDPGADPGFDLARCLAVLQREQVLTGITFPAPT